MQRTGDGVNTEEATPVKKRRAPSKSKRTKICILMTYASVNWARKNGNFANPRKFNIEYATDFVMREVRRLVRGMRFKVVDGEVVVCEKSILH